MRTLPVVNGKVLTNKGVLVKSDGLDWKFGVIVDSNYFWTPLKDELYLVLYLYRLDNAIKNIGKTITAISETVANAYSNDIGSGIYTFKSKFSERTSEFIATRTKHRFSNMKSISVIDIAKNIDVLSLEILGLVESICYGSAYIFAADRSGSTTYLVYKKNNCIIIRSTEKTHELMRRWTIRRYSIDALKFIDECMQKFGLIKSVEVTDSDNISLDDISVFVQSILKY